MFNFLFENPETTVEIASTIVNGFAIGFMAFFIGYGVASFISKGE